jgi:pyridoxal phosphate enzyme (YggS family)
MFFEPTMPLIAENLSALNREIAAAATAAGRDLSSIKLVAVSKTNPASAIRSAYGAGQTAFGENYVQEFRDKHAELSDLPLEWHFIGHLQSNKAKDVVGKASLIHTIDRLSLAETVNKIAAKKNLLQNALVEVKLGAEAGKFGCAPSDVPELLKRISEFESLRILGLMTIGTLTDDPSVTRAEFKALRELLETANAQGLYPAPLSELSMGMSGDFAIAIAEGATIIRVGTRIFGKRV